MAKGRSIHIGLNHVDPDAYGGWDGELSGCINDANSMEELAADVGYSRTKLIDDEATSEAVLGSLQDAAAALSTGDILLLTYSGHGGQLEDEDFDEEDSQDETWVLWDREVLDDELNYAFSAFSNGVRIFMLSDSCHSGTVSRVIYRDVPKIPALRTLYRIPAGAKALPFKLRGVERSLQKRIFAENRDMYLTIRSKTPRSSQVDVQASVLLISGCADNQLSSDGSQNGLFTQTLLEVWNGGSFSGDYRDFWRDMASNMPTTQSPNYYTTGVSDHMFEAQKPFTIKAPGEGEEEPGGGGVVVDVTAPSVTGPDSLSRGDDPPEFHVDTGSNPYYIFEAATEGSLFANYDAQTSSNFFATWADPGSPSRLEDESYTIPHHAWDALKPADRIYYRVGTTSSLTTWDDYQVSTPDDEGASAPYIQVTD
jgi:metacaspase-1